MRVVNVKPATRSYLILTSLSRLGPGSEVSHWMVIFCANVESYLVQVKYYFAHCIDAPNSKQLLKAPAIHIDVFSCIDLGTKALERDLPQAFAWFNRAFVNASALFTDGCFESMYDLLTAFSRGGRWECYDEIRRALLQYLGAVGRRVLGEPHPITKIVSILNQDFACVDTMQRVADLVLASSKQHSELNAQNEELLRLRIRNCKIYADTAEFDLAVHEILHIVKQCEMCWSPRHSLLRFAKYQLGYMHYKRRALHEAAKQWLEVIELCVTQTGRENGTDYCAQCCRSLGWIYGCEGRDDEAERYLRLAVEGALEFWGPADPETREHLEELKQFLEKRNRVDEVQLLRQECAEVYTSLNGYYLQQDDTGARFMEVA
jgi:tetratricopeptide (TPR) repeat protein